MSYDEEDGNDLLMGSGNGTPWAKWESNGDSVSGVVLARPKVKQARDYDTGKPKEYPSGDPVMNIIVLIQTGKTDPDIEDDKGVRQVVVKKGSNLNVALQIAVKKAGAKGLEEGGKLKITRTGEEKLKNSRGMSYTSRLFEAQYTPPPRDKIEEDALGALSGMLADKPPF